MNSGINSEPFTIWITGMSGAGKTSLAQILQPILVAELIDGDEIRKNASHIPNGAMPFGPVARYANVMHAATLAVAAMDSRKHAIVSLISPFREAREDAQAMIGHDRILTVALQCPISELEQRDTKGLYRQFRRGEIRQLSGMDQPYESPGPSENALILDTQLTCPACCRNHVLHCLQSRSMLPR